MTEEDKVLGLLGICMKAGKLVSGFDMVRDEIKNNNIKLIAVSNDISDNTLKKVMRLSANIKICKVGSMSKIGRAIGKSPKAVIGITDEGFAKKLYEMTAKLNEKQ